MGSSIMKKAVHYVALVIDTSVIDTSVMTTGIRHENHAEFEELCLKYQVAMETSGKFLVHLYIPEEKLESFIRETEHLENTHICIYEL